MKEKCSLLKDVFLFFPKFEVLNIDVCVYIYTMYMGWWFSIKNLLAM